MNNQDPSPTTWGSLVASLEDECDEVFNNDASNENGQIVQAGRNGNSGEGGEGVPLHDDSLTHPPLRSDQIRDTFETDANVALRAMMEAVHGEAKVNREAESNFQAVDPLSPLPPPVMAQRAHKTFKFRDWIKHAMHSVDNGASSPAYLKPAIKIAILLADQLIQAEKLARYGISEKLDLLSVGNADKWADSVIIRLKEADQHSHHQGRGRTDACLPFADHTQDINERLTSFLENYERNRTSELRSEFERNFSEVLGLSTAPGPDSTDEECNYLDVEYAEIRCPETDLNGAVKSDLSQNEIQRIYYLGLVLYELFSGGEAPPPELHALPLSDGAFVSLPTLTLVKSNDELQNNESECLPSQPKRRQGPSAGQGAGLCKLSFQYLKLLGLPGPICHMIFNMLDCIYGDLGGDECYTKLSDVTYDLQLMQNKPSKFLKDLDMDQLSMSGLQLDENVIPREEEFECIKNCYRRRVMGSNELAIIQGESGAGKSFLAQRIGKFVSDEGGVFLTGKFDQMKQMKPFSALASAFDQYCDVLIREKGYLWAKKVINKLHNVLGRDARHLIMLIPKLSQVLDITTSLADFNLVDQNCVHTKQRLHYLLCQFVEVISTGSEVSLMLFMDDVQWADDASISVLNLLLRREHKKIFFLWSCRDDEMANDHPIWRVIEDVRAMNIHATTVKLHCMKEEQLNQVMSDILCLSPRIVRSLSNIVYQKTKGNPLFFSQLLRTLNRNGLIRLDYDTQRWVWDEDKIYSMKLPDNVAACFAGGIKKLDSEIQFALQTVSMFGASAKISYIEELEKQLNLNLIDPLKAAAAEGLVRHLEGLVQFSHDRIQEVVYSMIDEKVRANNHLLYGACLVKLAERISDDDLYFTAVHQINLGGPSTLTNAAELIAMSRYNLAAGRRAMEMSGFSSAYRFFSCGVKFLPANHWSDHYEFSLELLEYASKAALVSGNEHCFNVFSDLVLNNARCFQDKLNINYIIMSSLVYTPKINEGLEMGRAILSRLGVDIPSNPSLGNLDEHIKSTQALIKGMSEDDILNYKKMTDEIKLTAMKFLAKTESIAVCFRPALHPFITLKMVQLTISHGLSPTSPVVFVCFGSLLAKAGNIQVGHRFAVLAERLLDKLKITEIKGEVMLAVTELKCFVEPILATNDIRAKAEHAAILAGDVYFGCISRLHYCLVLLWAGFNLDVVKESMSKACEYMKEQGEDTSLLLMKINQRTVLNLMGKETEAPTESELSGEIKSNGSRPRQMIVFSFNNLYISFFLNNHVTVVKEYAQKFLEHRIETCYILYSDTMQAYILGLAAFQICRESATPESLQWLSIGQKCTSEMKTWAEQGSPFNFQQKFLLMKAEEFYCVGNVAAAKETYNNAIAYARSHKVLSDEALACELAAKFYLNIGDLNTSLEYFRIAHEKYDNWGSSRKANLLFQFISDKFSGLISNRVSSMAFPMPDDLISRKRRGL